VQGWNVELDRIVVHDRNRGIRHHARGLAWRPILGES
jgi:hypothetical protein